MKHHLPELSYAYNALEPFIDEQTMQIHHTKHHQTYVDKLNAALERHTELQGETAEELVSDLDRIPADVRQAVRNHAGGHANHSFFWLLLKKDTKPESAPTLLDAIKKRFNSLERFKEEFTTAANNHFGSGWAWLVLNNDELEIITTQNQDSPLSTGKTPIIGLDVWEHAYYLKFQNKRAEYTDAWWNVLNWEQAEKNFQAALNPE
jgi:superoxide dismutase, Fe-Mn family